MADEKQVVACNHCKTQLRYKPRPGLEKIPCPKCKKEVLVGLSKLINELPPFDYSKLAPVASEMVKSAAKSDDIDAQRFETYFPDFRVRTFWTPNIVAVLWTVFLVACATQAVAVIVVTAVGVFARPTLQLVLGWLLLCFLVTLSSVLLSLIVRIALEAVQVLFRIEEHLRD